MINTNPNTPDVRYERKFDICNSEKHQIELMIKTNPVGFAEIFHPRRVNNIYFDTPDLSSYFDNIDGVQDRTKTRIRWYGDIFGRIETPSLELKHKRGLSGWKQTFDFPTFDFHSDFENSELSSITHKSNLPLRIKELLKIQRPTLFNTYYRKYYKSFNGNFRITLDTDLAFCKLLNKRTILPVLDPDLSHVILELKYHNDVALDTEVVTNYFRYRLSRVSKYVTGVEEWGMS